MIIYCTGMKNYTGNAVWEEYRHLDAVNLMSLTYWHKKSHISLKSKIQYHIEAILKSGVGKEHFEI